MQTFGYIQDPLLRRDLTLQCYRGKSRGNDCVFLGGYLVESVSITSLNRVRTPRDLSAWLSNEVLESKTFAAKAFDMGLIMSLKQHV